MKHNILIILIFCIFGTAQTQNRFKAYLKDEQTKEPLAYADVVLEGTQKGATTDSTGFVQLDHIPDGKHTLIFSYVGYRTKEKRFTFPMENQKPVTIYLEKTVKLNEVVVYSTRTNNRIKEIPTRIEVLGQGEVTEETAINPGNISKLLGETSGIEVQQTSAVSGNVSFRIQGLPGKYTQLLQDGFPIYSGFSSGLSLLQIPPLDLKQVEIVKGSASTLYGADAIAGIVNLITKKPAAQPQFSLLINQTHKGETDFSSFYSHKKGSYGITMLTSINGQKATDVSGNSFTDIPRFLRTVLSPKLFYDINDNNRLYIGFSSVIEERTGGDIKAVNGAADSLHAFFEQNKTKRFNSTAKFEHTGTSGNIFTVKAAYGNFDRKMKTNTNTFSGIQNNVFAEISYFVNKKRHKLVGGLNFYSDDFKQSQPATFSTNYSYQTVGAFVQDNWKLTEHLSAEPGIRYDYNLGRGGFFLPRLAVMYRISKNFFTRLSAGMGYKLPTPFTDDAERTRYQKVLFPAHLKAERSTGANLDFNFKTPLWEELFLTLNQSFFLTTINGPITANADSLQNNVVFYENSTGAVKSKGINTNIRLSLDELNLYIDYTYLDARKTYDGNKRLELTPQNRLTATLAYEDEEKGWKTGLEAFYFGNQFLSDGTKTPDYWMLGASAQKRIGHFTLALNAENILDVRQTKFENIVSGPADNPQFSEIYAPLNGIVFNAVLKFDLY